MPFPTSTSTSTSADQRDVSAVDPRGRPMVSAVDGPRLTTIEPSYDQLPAARAFVAPYLPGSRLSDALYTAAFTEVVTNAITAQIDAGARSPIEIHVETDPLVVEVVDTGTGFPSEDRRRLGGGLRVAAVGSPDLSWSENEPSGTRFVLPYPSMTS